MILILCWIALAAVVASMGKERKIGYAAVFWISVFFSPIIGALIALGSERKTSEPFVSADAQRLFSAAIGKAKSGKYEDAINDLKQSLALQPKYYNAHYNLACCYSRLDKKEDAFRSLSCAVANGYDNFEKIQSDPDLAFIRTQPEFVEFAASGYKTNVQLDNSSDVLDKLERLSALKEKGILAESEFLQQKSKLIGGK